MAEKDRISEAAVQAQNTIVQAAAAPDTGAQTAVSPDTGAEEAGCPFCSGRSKVRDPKEQRDLINRLNRIEGQIRGIKGMLEGNAYCIDILNQVSAANSALNSFTKVLLAQHIRTCVAEDLHKGNDEKLEELVKTLQKLMR